VCARARTRAQRKREKRGGRRKGGAHIQVLKEIVGKKSIKY